MAQQFKIIRNKNHYAIQFSLMGDFDTTAARALAEALEKETAAERIVVQTSCVSRVIPGAAEIHAAAFSEIERLQGRVVFCGEHAWDIAPWATIVYYG